MGKGGGGGGGPQVSTAYQTNLPEYAEPYVKNMLQAAEAQVYAPGKTGFREYTPYSANPADYFAGPSSLQKSTYGEASGMQTPGQFAPATGIAGAAGLGQLGAGGAYQQMATSPGAISAYMSPFAQNVIDVQKAAAMREAQIGNVGNKLAAARQGTYGGAREALGRLERERSLQSRLGEIQATGSQQAYDRAIQNMQFGSNLGLQGLAGASQTAGALAGIGGQQQQADLSRMGFQNQLGQQQQQFQQNIINQAIQDYATQQQYPFMQLSTMSNLLRGLPMQGMTTQQYQAQPSALQQGIGLLGTGASLYGAMRPFKEGGEIKGLGYANRGQVDSMRDRLEEMFATDPEDTAKYVAQSSSPSVKKIARELGIGGAPTGKLGTNMAGGGIIAFGDGGDVPGFFEGGDTMGGFAFEGPSDMIPTVSDFSDEEKLDYLRKKGRLGLAQAKDLQEGKVTLDQLFKNSYSPSSTTAAQAKTVTPPASPAAPPSAKKDNVVPPGPPPTAAVTTGGDQKTGIAKFLADQDAALAARGVTPGMGEETRGLMDFIKEGKARRQSEAGQDRYLRMAKAFSQFGSTAGPLMSSASKALGGFAEGEAVAKKELRAADLADKRMTADIEKGQRAEARGDYAAAQKAYDSAENREVQREGHRKSAEASMYGADREKRMVERAMEDPEFLKTMQAMKGNDNVTVQAIKAQLVDIGQQIMMAGKDEALKKKLMEQRAALNARLAEIAKVSDKATAAAPAGGAVNKDNPLLKG